MYTMTYAVPIDEGEYISSFEERNVLNNSPSITQRRQQSELTEQILERPYDIWDMFKDITNSSDFRVYKEIHKDEHFKRLCWAEILIITEDNKRKNKTLSREFAIILENPGDILKEDLDEGKIEPYEIWVGDAKKSKTLNFTTVRTTDNFTIKHHKTLFCGAGPVLTKEYFDWPKLNKKKIEIRLSSSTPTAWRISNENDFIGNCTIVQETQPSCSTFDTTETNEYNSKFTNIDTTEATVFDASENPFALRVIEEEENNRKISNINSNIVDERFDFEDTDTSTSMSHNTKNIKYNNTGSRKDLPLGPEDEVLRQKVYFKKLKNKQHINNSSEEKEQNYDFDRHFDNTEYLYNIIFSNKSIFNSLCVRNSINKFFIKIKIHLEHRTVDCMNGTCQETIDSVMGIEEDSVHHLSSEDC